ncbi:hypothetical protein TYRP_012579 [Tyrophagus putrescentiae]|nr:hypothetical protein TYRP_012579 [Tyrophagus putrescentiae]
MNRCQFKAEDTEKMARSGKMFTFRFVPNLKR